MKYKYSMSEFEFNETQHKKPGVYSACTVCGRLHQGNLGFTIDYNLWGHAGAMQRKLCRKCASANAKFIESLIEHFKDLGSQPEEPLEFKEEKIHDH